MNQLSAPLGGLYCKIIREACTWVLLYIYSWVIFGSFIPAITRELCNKFFETPLLGPHRDNSDRSRWIPSPLYLESQVSIKKECVSPSNWANDRNVTRCDTSHWHVVNHKFWIVWRDLLTNVVPGVSYMVLYVSYEIGSGLACVLINIALFLENHAHRSTVHST